MIVRMTSAHVDQVVAVHLHSFEGFFLSFLGPRFLRLYYDSIVDYPDAAGYVFVRGERVIGLVCGARQSSQFYRFLLRTRWPRFALASLGAALRRPSILPRLARAWLAPTQNAAEADSATLTSIAVEPDQQGQGVGSALLAAFLQDMRMRGVHAVVLTTDQKANQAANEFYRRRGFHCRRTLITPEGRVMNEYLICLGREETEATASDAPAAVSRGIEQ